MTARTTLGIVTGSGDLPGRLAAHARSTGRDVFILSLNGSADPALIDQYGGADISIGEIGKQMDSLKAAGCNEVVFAGVVRRPDFSTLRLDMRGALLMPKVIAAAGKGDDALLRVAISAYEDAGFRVIGADDILTDLLAPAGAFGKIAPTEAHWADLKLAAKVASAIGALDVGQGAVSCNGIILAVEAQEGTDLMLARVGELPIEIRGTPEARRGVLVKRPKPIQELRIDLPTIGTETVRRAAESGLAGIAVQAGKALILDREGVIALADSLGVFVYGFSEGEVA